MTTDQYQRCGLLKRLLSISYDALLLSAVLFLATGIILPITGGAAIDSGNPAYTLYLLLCCYVYFCWQWLHGGQTLGMRAWRIQLIGNHQMPIDWKSVTLRFLLAGISWLILGLGYLWSIIDPDKLAFHDRYSKTVLILKPSASIKIRK